MKNTSAITREFIEKGKSLSCPIIDMHGHYGPFSWVYMPNIDDEDMLHSMDRAGVKVLVFSAHHALVVSTEKGNSITREVIHRHPGRFYGYWAVNPNYPEDIAEDLKNFEKEKGFIGFKFWSDYHQYSLTGRNYMPVYEYVNERGLCILMHTWGYSPFDGPELVREVSEKYPNIHIIMGHGGYGEWDTAIKIAKEFKRIYLDITAVYATHDGIMLKWAPERNFGIGVNGIIAQMVEGTGSEKILFGTDLPWYSPHYAAGAVLFSRLTDENIHNIFHRNAEQIFKGIGIKI